MSLIFSLSKKEIFCRDSLFDWHDETATRNLTIFSADLLSAQRAALRFFDAAISLNGARVGHKIRKEQNRRIIKAILPQLVEALGLPTNPLPRFAYDDEKTFVLVNVKVHGMQLHEKREFVFEEQVHRLHDGTTPTMTYLVNLTYTKDLAIGPHDFNLMRASQTKEEVRGVIERLQVGHLNF